MPRVLASAIASDWLLSTGASPAVRTVDRAGICSAAFDSPTARRNAAAVAEAVCHSATNDLTAAAVDRAAVAGTGLASAADDPTDAAGALVAKALTATGGGLL